LEAVTELATASQSPWTSQQQFDEIVEELLAAGEPLHVLPLM